jgi:hypothetical protein
LGCEMTPRPLQRSGRRHLRSCFSRSHRRFLPCSTRSLAPRYTHRAPPASRLARDESNLSTRLQQHRAADMRAVITPPRYCVAGAVAHERSVRRCIRLVGCSHNSVPADGFRCCVRSQHTHSLSNAKQQHCCSCLATLIDCA